MSKLLKKYNELKSKDKNKIYLFKVGIFYNIFNSDADILSKALGLKITQLSDTLYKVGFLNLSGNKFLNRRSWDGRCVLIF